MCMKNCIERLKELESCGSVMCTCTRVPGSELLSIQVLHVVAKICSVPYSAGDSNPAKKYKKLPPKRLKKIHVTNDGVEVENPGPTGHSTYIEPSGVSMRFKSSDIGRRTGRSYFRPCDVRSCCMHTCFAQIPRHNHTGAPLKHAALPARRSRHSSRTSPAPPSREEDA